jgi:hypothetical protein
MAKLNQQGVFLVVLIVVILIAVVVIGIRARSNHTRPKSSSSFLTRGAKQEQFEVGRSRRSRNSASDSPTSDNPLQDIGARCSTTTNDCLPGLQCVDRTCVCQVPLPVRISEVNVTATGAAISWFPATAADSYAVVLYRQTGDPTNPLQLQTTQVATTTNFSFNNLTPGNYLVRIYSASNRCGSSNAFTEVPFTPGVPPPNTTITADTIIANKIVDGGTLINPHPTKVAVTGSKFDCSQDNPAFPTLNPHSPVKPANVPDALWTEMLVNLVEEQRRLTENFIAGRNALGLPQAEKINPDGSLNMPVQLIATKTTTLSAFQLDANTWTFEPEIGWDLHCANTFYRDFINPQTITASGTFAFSGNVGLEEGQLLLDDPSIMLEYGLVLRGPNIPWGTTIYDTSRSAKGEYLLSVSTPSARFTGPINFEASKWGPKNASIFIQAGNLNQITGVPLVIDIAHGNRQFEPTIDYSSMDTAGLTHTGEEWIGTKQIPSGLSLSLSLISSINNPIVQLAIFAETGVDVYFKPPDCTPVVAGKRLVNQGQPGVTGANSTANATIVQEGKIMLEIVSAVAVATANPARVVITYTLAGPASLLDQTKRFFTAVQNGNPGFNGEFGDSNPTTINGNIVTIETFVSDTLRPGATSTGGRLFRDDVCFSGEALVLMANGQHKEAKTVRVGDKVASLNGEIIEIIGTTLHPKGQGQKRLVDMSYYAPGLIISDYHRVQIDGQWVRPYDVPHGFMYYDDIDLYNFVADRRLPVIVNGLPATTLGMYCEGGTHNFELYPTQKFWCTDAIVEHLQARSDWPNVIFTTRQIAAMKQV